MQCRQHAFTDTVQQNVSEEIVVKFTDLQNTNINYKVIKGCTPPSTFSKRFEACLRQKNVGVGPEPKIQL